MVRLSLLANFHLGLYWAMATISTAGYGDVTGNTKSSPEVIYSILILIVGMLVYSVGENSKWVSILAFHSLTTRCRSHCPVGGNRVAAGCDIKLT